MLGRRSFCGSVNSGPYEPLPVEASVGCGRGGWVWGVKGLGFWGLGKAKYRGRKQHRPSCHNGFFQAHPKHTTSKHGTPALRAGAR